MKIELTRGKEKAGRVSYTGKIETPHCSMQQTLTPRLQTTFKDNNTQEHTQHANESSSQEVHTFVTKKKKNSQNVILDDTHKQFFFFGQLVHGSIRNFSRYLRCRNCIKKNNISNKLMDHCAN